MKALAACGTLIGAAVLGSPIVVGIAAFCKELYVGLLPLLQMFGLA